MFGFIIFILCIILSATVFILLPRVTPTLTPTPTPTPTNKPRERVSYNNYFM